MDHNPSLDADLTVDNEQAEDVKGGIRMIDVQTTQHAGGATVHASTDGASVQRAGLSASVSRKKLSKNAAGNVSAQKATKPRRPPMP